MKKKLNYTETIKTRKSGDVTIYIPATDSWKNITSSTISFIRSVR